MIGPFVFLDVDGVLNSHNRHVNGFCGCDADSVQLLNKLLERTNARIILVSTWRYFVLRGEMDLAGLNGLFHTHGLKYGSIVDILGPDIPNHRGSADRGQGICNWFRERFYISHDVKYLVLDDMDLGYSRRGLPFKLIDGTKGFAMSISNREFEELVQILGGR